MAGSLSVRRAAALLVLLLASALAARADERETEEWIRPYVGALPRAYDEGACFLLRDARTGRPLPRVWVSRGPEMEFGEDGWATYVQEVMTDVHGLASVPLPEDVGDNHWVIHGPGYGTTEEYGTFVHDVIDLEPGRARHGRVVDGRGRPLGGLLVEHKIGCAHSPSIHRARTDENGVFVFEDVGHIGDVIVSGSGVLYAYHGQDLRPLDMTPSAIRVEPGVAVSGRIEVTDGELLTPRMVLAMTTWRGPLAVLDKDGNFTLEGTDGDCTLQLHHWLRSAENEPQVLGISLGEFRAGGPFVWRIGQKAEDEEDGQETTAVAFQVLGPQRNPLDGVEVHFDRLSDGRRFYAHSDPSDDAPLPSAQLPAGRYEASVGDSFSGWVGGPVAFTHPTSAPVEIPVGERPRVVLEVVNGVAEPFPQGGLYVDDASESFDVESVLAGEATLYLPAEAPAWVVLDSAAGTARAEVGSVKDGRRVARLVFPPPRWIEMTDVWGEAEVEIELLDGHLQLVERKEGIVRFATGESGRLPLRIVHPEYGSGYAVVDVPADLKTPGIVDLAAVDWSDGPTKRDLVIVPPGGRRLDEPRVHVGRVPQHGFGVPYDTLSLDGVNEPDGAARVTSAGLRSGSDVIVEPDFEGGDAAERWLRFYTRLEGDGPYRVALPDGALDLEVVLANEDEDDVTVVVGGEVERWDVKGGRRVAKLRGLVPGAHHVLVGAPGHESRVARVVIREGEVKRLRIELPLRRP